jgi:hypothetical protein
VNGQSDGGADRGSAVRPRLGVYTAKPWVSDQGTPTMRVEEPRPHDGGMLIHPSIQLELVRAKQHDLLARAERDHLAAAPSAPAGYVRPGPPEPLPGAASLWSLRELACRENDGIEIRLLWSPEDNRLTVTVFDARSGDLLSRTFSPSDPLDVFEHPYAYARPAPNATGDPDRSRRPVTAEC